jgi:hypothetical protein
MGLNNEYIQTEYTEQNQTIINDLKQLVREFGNNIYSHLFRHSNITEDQRAAFFNGNDVPLQKIQRGGYKKLSKRKTSKKKTSKKKTSKKKTSKKNNIHIDL